MEDKVSALFHEHFGSRPESIFPFAASGSDRKYYRLKVGNKQVVAAYSLNLDENLSFAGMAAHFSKMGIRVPKVLAISGDHTCYLLEDLGDTCLLDLVKGFDREAGLDENQMQLYRSSLAMLAKLQAKGLQGLNPSLLISGEKMGYDMVLSDLHYFKFCFLKASGISFPEQELEEDFRALAKAFDALPSDFFLYRDFQGRNIMVQNEQVWFIDFQGGMNGPPMYDAVSLLYQAKASLSRKNQESLKDYYYRELIGYSPLAKAEFDQGWRLCVLARMLQVLGAYGFRGNFEKKKHFLESIPHAIRNLGVFLASGEYPEEFAHLKKVLSALVASYAPEILPSSSSLEVYVRSFSYKKGIPTDETGNGGGFVFDCRSIDNPGRIEAYKSQTGLHIPVIRFLMNAAGSESFFDNASALVESSVKNYLQRGFANLSVSFGCTGGQHRSVYFAEKLAKLLKEKYPVQVRLEHREANNWPTESLIRK